jgi:hypothetical protein
MRLTDEPSIIMTSQLLLLLALSPLTDASEDAKTLQTIRAAVRENFTSIHSLELQYHTYEPATKTHLPNWEWTIQGDKFLLATVGTGKQIANGPDFRSRNSFDGKNYYRIDYDPDDLTRVRSIARSSAARGLHDSMATPLRLFGWKLMACDQTFLGLLDGAGARVLGMEDVEGTPCWKVDLGMVTFKGKTTNRLTAWFDPAVGHWMRRLLGMPEIVPPKEGERGRLADGQILYDYVATEFDRFDDLTLGGQRWFPTRYKMIVFNDPREVIFENIKINPPISDELFTPDIPVGMLVTDEPGTPEQVSYYAGGDAGYEAYKKATLKEAAELSKVGPGNPLIDARSDGSLRWTLILLSVSLVVFVIGCGIWWRSRSHG